MEGFLKLSDLKLVSEKRSFSTRRTSQKKSPPSINGSWHTATRVLAVNMELSTVRKATNRKKTQGEEN
jgi:hypothetical protein